MCRVFHRNNDVISPSIESVQEFKLITSGFSAEYGKYAGGVLSVISKSGTNRFRGTAYEFMRNDVFDARSFFSAKFSSFGRVAKRRGRFVNSSGSHLKQRAELRPMAPKGTFQSRTFTREISCVFAPVRRFRSTAA